MAIEISKSLYSGMFQQTRDCALQREDYASRFSSTRYAILYCFTSIYDQRRNHQLPLAYMLNSCSICVSDAGELVKNLAILSSETSNSPRHTDVTNTLLNTNPIISISPICL